MPSRKKPDSLAEYRFDADAAERAVAFFSECLTHVTGEWRGQPFILSDWQAEIVRQVEMRCLAEGYWTIVLSSHGERKLEARRIDLQQRLPLRNLLVVVDEYRGNRT